MKNFPIKFISTIILLASFLLPTFAYSYNPNYPRSITNPLQVQVQVLPDPMQQINQTIRDQQMRIQQQSDAQTLSDQQSKAQQIQANSLLESQLKIQYGYSIYSSCQASVCGSYNAVDPFAAHSCLIQLESWLGRGMCLAQRQQVNTSQQVPIQPKGTLCNGISYSACPLNENLICPQSGNAYCESTNSDQYCQDTYGANYGQNQAQTKCETYDQICQDRFGSNGAWDGSKNSSGGLNCGCQAGYASSNDGQSCVAIPRKSSVTSVNKIAPTPNAAVEQVVDIATTSSNIAPSVMPDINNTASVSSAVPTNMGFWARIRSWLGF